MRKGVRPLAAPAIEALSYDRLLAYKRTLLELADSRERSEASSAELAALDPELIHFKSDVTWRPMLEAVLEAMARAGRS